MGLKVNNIDISDFNYPLPDERIARFPAAERDASKLLVWRGDGSGGPGGDESGGVITETSFAHIGEVLPEGALLVFNDTRVVKARLVMHKAPRPDASGSGDARKGVPWQDALQSGEPRHDDSSQLETQQPNAPQQGARIEILCLEPHDPADYERAFAVRGECVWRCMVGNLKKWKSGPLEVAIPAGAVFADEDNTHGDSTLRAWLVREEDGGPQPAGKQFTGEQQPTATHPPGEQLVRFEWDAPLSFGEVLETLGRVPIPPYLRREEEEIDRARYQTVYAVWDGSVAAPTAGLHFTPELIARLAERGTQFERVTLHVGAGTFLPVKAANALEHPMHTEHFEVTLAALDRLRANFGGIIAVGTTSVRTLESLPALAWRIAKSRREEGGGGSPRAEIPVGQFEMEGVGEEFDGAAALDVLIEWMRARGVDKLAASTRIMITPGFRFRLTRGIVTNFHQPQSTLLLLVSAFVDGGKPVAKKTPNAPKSQWRRIYDYALEHDFRFLSYGDSSLLLGR